MSGASGKRIWLVTWTRDGGRIVVHVASSRARAFAWVRSNFHPELELPSKKNVVHLIPMFVDREASGVIPVSAFKSADGNLVFVDLATGRQMNR